MKAILEHFRTISATPRCSRKAEEMRDVIVTFAKEQGFRVSVDDAQNILCQKGTPKLCLQAHYDMVCLGDVQNLELVIDGDIVRAKNSTLGADNGMGMAIMFECMREFSDIECLFTSDEEVGLIGAGHLGLQLASDKLLNLDGEDESEIYVGCAGGADIEATMHLAYAPLDADEQIYELRVKNLAGGHSGVDIDKNIPSAIKILASELARHELKLLDIEGGEVRNSIPKNAKAIIASKHDFASIDPLVHVQKINYKREYIKNSEQIIKALDAFAQGVRAYDKEFMIPLVSISMGLVRTQDGVLCISSAARAMREDDLLELSRQTESFFGMIGFETKIQDFHAPWMPDVGPFAQTVKSKMSKIYKNIEFRAIHAGLECGILLQTQNKPIEAVSIGPTIRSPHSLAEECDLGSVARIHSVVKDIIQG